MSRFAVFVLAFACVLAPAAADDVLTRQIAVGRLDVMMSESREVLSRLAIPQAPPRPGTSGPNNGEIFDTLELAVLDYNVLSFQACHTGAVGPELCHGPYLPGWLTAKAGDFTDAQLDAMIAGTTDRLMPFWTALCAGAQRSGAPEPVCPME
jgi:hypothetical protein